MCKPGEPCPGAEEAPKSLTQLVVSQKKYLSEIKPKLVAAFGDDVADSLYTLLHTNLIVDSMFAKIEEGRPRLDDKSKEDSLAGLLDNILSALFGGAQESIWDSFQEINIRFVRQVLDDYGVPDEKRAEHMKLLSEVVTATEEFTFDKVDYEAWTVDTSIELGGALSFLYTGVTQASIGEKMHLRNGALASIKARRAAAPATPQ